LADESTQSESATINPHPNQAGLVQTTHCPGIGTRSRHGAKIRRELKTSHQPANRVRFKITHPDHRVGEGARSKTSHPSDQLERAAKTATHHGTWRLRDLKRLLDQPSNVVQLDFLTTHPLIRQLDAYGVEFPTNTEPKP